METKDAALLVRLRELFTLEAQEHLQAITTGLLELEKPLEEAQYAEWVETLYREVHTLKGAARAVNLAEVETICQVTESVCAALKRKEFGVWPELFDTLHRTMDVVRQLSALPEGTRGEVPVGLVKELEGLEAQGRAHAAESTLTPTVASPLPEHPLFPSKSEEEAPRAVANGERDALLVRLRELFTLEAQEHLQAITTGLLELEKPLEEAQYAEWVETLYREVHTLKGAARAVNLAEVETICQVTESVCAALKRKEFGVWPELFDTLHRTMDVVRQLSALPEGTRGEVPVGLVKELEGLEAQGRAHAAESTLTPTEPGQLPPLPFHEGQSPPETRPENPQRQSESTSILPFHEAKTWSSVETALTAPVATSEPSTTKKRRRTSATPRATTPKQPRASKKKVAVAAIEEEGPKEETAAVKKKARKKAAESVLHIPLTTSTSEGLSPSISSTKDRGREDEEVVLTPDASSMSPEVKPTPQATHQLHERASIAAEEPSIADPAQREMLARLRGIFALEAEEYLHTITNTVLALEHEQGKENEKVLIETLFRCIHSLKGAARAVNFQEVEGICQIVENVCAALKRKEFSVWPEFFDAFHRVMDAVRQLSTASEGQATPPLADIWAEVSQLEAQARAHANQAQPHVAPPVNVPPVLTSTEGAQAPQADLSADEPEQDIAHDEPLLEEEEPTLSPERVRELFDAPSPTPTPAVGTGIAKSASANVKGASAQKASAPASVVRVEAAKLDSLFLQAEEMLAVKLKTYLHASELRELTALLEVWKREWVRVHTDIRKTQRILEKEENRNSRDPLYEQAAKLIDFLDWIHAHFRTVDHALTKVAKVVTQDQQALSGMVDILLEEAKKALMLPVASALEVLPKMARDLSRAQGKEVEFVVQGGEIEVDKRILEEIKDPLIHILRNCIDHGIESPDERERRQKPRCGSILVALSPGDGNSVEIVVQDNGAGIDAARVKAAAVKSGAISREVADRLPDQEAIALIFQSEVSTSATVSDISGRGLGMAIVREKVEKLGGRIAVETRLHQGTTFRITLPLTLATFRGVLVQAAGHIFVVPTVNVERILRFHRDAIQAAGNKEMIAMAGHTLPFLQLERFLGLVTKKRDEERGRIQLAVVVGQGEQQVAFGVDAVLNEQEVLFKSLGPQLVRVRNIAGATILGSGQVAPVLNVNDLLTTMNGVALPFSMICEDTDEEEQRQKSILVAEDSITSRMLLKEILESAGYAVSTAIDGEDALSSLEKARFDLVVSDVEMPRMNGFDLASKIRGDERYAHLPVVLVTGLESRADRERGMNAGANAYIVKGSFDQSNLLETIRQFL